MIVTQITNHYAIFQVKGELDQLLCGLLMYLFLLRSEPVIMQLFVPFKNPPLSADGMFDLNYSLPGSNAKEQEVGLYGYNFHSWWKV